MINKRHVPGARVPTSHKRHSWGGWVRSGSVAPLPCRVTRGKNVTCLPSSLQTGGTALPPYGNIRKIKYDHAHKVLAHSGTSKELRSVSNHYHYLI